MRHLAMFPEELPRRLIRMFSFVGDTVLDPFLGSGTTTLAARNLDRHSIGYEINPDFVKVIKEKMNRVPRSSGPGFDPDLTAQSRINRRGESATGGHARPDIEFITRDDGDVDYAAAIQRLPYIFHDPIAIDKKMDPRKNHFGSRIMADPTEGRPIRKLR